MEELKHHDTQGSVRGLKWLKWWTGYSVAPYRADPKWKGIWQSFRMVKPFGRRFASSLMDQDQTDCDQSKSQSKQSIKSRSRAHNF